MSILMTTFIKKSLGNPLSLRLVQKKNRPEKFHLLATNNRIVFFCSKFLDIPENRWRKDAFLANAITLSIRINQLDHIMLVKTLGKRNWGNQPLIYRIILGNHGKWITQKVTALIFPITFPQFCLLFLNKCCFSPKRHFFHNQTLIFNECMFRQFLLNSLFIVISSSSNLNLGFAI